MKVCLLACGKLKLPKRAKAGELYISTLFKAMRGYAQAHCDRWYVLSDQYGLLDPEKVVQPYGRDLKLMSQADKGAWAALVLGQLRPLLSPGDEVVLLLDTLHRKGVEKNLLEWGYSVTVPMRGLSLAEQVVWLQGAL